MRKNYVFEPGVPASRNEIIDMLKDKKETILLKNSIFTEIKNEINSNLKDKKIGKKLSKAGSGMGIIGFLFSQHPIGWLIIGCATLGIGINQKLSNDFRKYDMYTGKDKDDKEILLLVRNTRVDFKYDTINYPNWVGSIGKKTHKIK